MTGLLYFTDDLPPSSFVFSSANSGHKGMLSLPDSSCHPLSCIFAVLVNYVRLVGLLKKWISSAIFLHHETQPSPQGFSSLFLAKACTIDVNLPNQYSQTSAKFVNAR